MKPMTKIEYRAIIAALGLSQGRAGAFLGVGDRTSRRWALGESAVPNPVAIVLRYMARQNLKPERVASITAAKWE